MPVISAMILHVFIPSLSGVTLHVGNALNNHSVKMRDRIVTIGIAPWGVLNDRESLVGKDVSSFNTTIQKYLFCLNLCGFNCDVTIGMARQGRK